MRDPSPLPCRKFNLTKGVSVSAACQVFKANRFGCQPVAVKVLREESGKQIENFQREIVLLRGLRDNNMVMFLGVCLKDKQLMLVTEFMPQGDLWKAINHNTSRKFSWYQRWVFVHLLLLGSPCVVTDL